MLPLTRLPDAGGEATRRALLERLAAVRSTGAQGGRIDPHRAIATIDLPRRDVLFAIVLTVVLTVVYGACLRWVGELWTAMFSVLAEPLGFGGGVLQRSTTIASVAHVSLPYFAASAGPPSWLGWWVTLIVTVVVVAASFLLRSAWTPLGYALRFAATIQITALVFFAVAPARFPYDLAAYVSGMMLVGAMLIGIVPLVLGLTFYVIDVGWGQKIALTLLVMGHLLVLVPLQYALQSVVIAHASLLVLPLAFTLFGLLPEIMVLIALYGWGMSWAPLRARGRRE